MNTHGPSTDPRAQAIWSAFGERRQVADHFARAAGRFAGRPAWSLIVPMEADAVQQRANEVQRVVGTALGASPVERLHITLFTLALEPPAGWEVAVASAIAGSPELTIEIGGVNAFPESVFLEVNDPAGLRAIRKAVRAACPWIEGGVPEEYYLPHVSVVYFGTDGDCGPLVHQLEGQRGLEPIALRVDSLMASRLEFDAGGRSRRLESTRFALGGVE